MGVSKKATEHENLSPAKIFDGDSHPARHRHGGFHHRPAGPRESGRDSAGRLCHARGAGPLQEKMGLNKPVSYPVRNLHLEPAPGGFRALLGHEPSGPAGDHPSLALHAGAGGRGRDSFHSRRPARRDSFRG